MKTLPKVLLGVAAFAAIFFGFRYLVESGVIPMPGGKSEVPKTAALPNLPDQAGGSTQIAALPLPGKNVVGKGHPIRMQIWAWNAQSGLLLANGGARSTEGSLMAQHGIDLSITREDDVSKMSASLIAFAKALKGNPQPTEGVHYIALMGDGTAAFFAALNPKLKEICDDCVAEVIGSCGYSRGEDKFMGLPEWKGNPKLAKGALIAGVLRDGDWNIAMKWAGDNGLKNNPDETTWDPEALNWVNVDTYVDAAKKYVMGVCEDRKVVKDGKAAVDSDGKSTHHVCVNGVVTWTPGDVDVAKHKGGLLSIVSTKEYRSQMPNIIIGIRKWNRANRDKVESFLASIFEGGDQVKHHATALRRAAEISVEVYKEETADYWERYFKGVTETDKAGLQVPLGGSSVNNYADNLALFGLAPGSANLYAATYTIFGDIVVQQYPKLVPSYPKLEEILDTSYLSNLKGKVPTSEAEHPVFTSGASIKEVVGKRAWDIHFETGKATFTKDATTELEQLAKGLLVADELAIEIHGHTDNTGDANANMALSEARAAAVKNWLTARAASEFPSERMKVVPHGQREPVCADQSTEACRSKNRRVVVILGST
jgi:outer membrane protein OmpA-like peptidoglycan-associated protein